LGGTPPGSRAYSRISLHGRPRRLVRAERTLRLAAKAALGDEIVYAVLRRHQIIKASLVEQVELGCKHPPNACLSRRCELVVAPPAIRGVIGADGAPLPRSPPAG
jgi:hypothetical protein